QCDNCGNQLDPDQLVNPRSKINGETPEFVETEHFFLDLPAFASALNAWLDQRSGWRPNVLRFSKNLSAWLRQRALTRHRRWGGGGRRVGKGIIVGFGGGTGCLSASSGGARRSGDPEAWRKWWQTQPSPGGAGDTARGYYFMGKDNIVFHSVIWPSMLLGYS